MVWPGKVDRRYWIDPEPGPDDYVDINFDRCIFHHPIGVDELRRDPDFYDASILRMPKATSFVLTAEHWHAIERRVDRRRPTPYPRLARHPGTEL